eukprot:7375989-Prymnesium_polylepis.2
MRTHVCTRGTCTRTHAARARARACVRACGFTRAGALSGTSGLSSESRARACACHRLRRYQVLLTRPQLTVKSALEPLHYLAGDAEVRNSPMWPVIENLLREFGWTPQENDNDKRFARRSQTSAKLIL